MRVPCSLRPAHGAQRGSCLTPKWLHHQPDRMVLWGECALQHTVFQDNCGQGSSVLSREPNLQRPASTPASTLRHLIFCTRDWSQSFRRDMSPLPSAAGCMQGVAHAGDGSVRVLLGCLLWLIRGGGVLSAAADGQARGPEVQHRARQVAAHTTEEHEEDEALLPGLLVRAVWHPAA